MLALAGLPACSLLVEHETNQCATDADCAKYGPHPFCQQGVCVESGLGPAGCFYGAPGSDEQFLNQCTTLACVPFDNCARLGLCNGATLPPVLPKP